MPNPYDTIQSVWGNGSVPNKEPENIEMHFKTDVYYRDIFIGILRIYLDGREEFTSRTKGACQKWIELNGKRLAKEKL
jgi:hypothetical protein